MRYLSKLAFITNHHHLGDLGQHKCIRSQSWRPVSGIQVRLAMRAEAPWLSPAPVATEAPWPWLRQCTCGCPLLHLHVAFSSHMDCRGIQGPPASSGGSSGWPCETGMDRLPPGALRRAPSLPAWKSDP